VLAESICAGKDWALAQVEQLIANGSFLSLLRLNENQEAIRRYEIGVESQRFAEGRFRLGQFLLRHERGRQANPRQGQSGLQPNRFTTMRLGLVEIALLNENRGELQMRQAVVRAQAQSFRIGGSRWSKFLLH